MSDWIIRAVTSAAAIAVAVVPARAQCTKSDFEAVVDEAAGALRDLNAANKPKFQDKLRLLKDKRGWGNDQFIKEAAPLVADDKINAYDQQSSALLDKIASGGEAGAAAATPDCMMLETLRSSMKTLVDTQSAKWSYMTTKIDTELGK